MIVKSLLFSFTVSLVSLAIVVLAPITITMRSSGVVHSPYRVELDALTKRTANGLHPSAPEWHRMKELIEKNNRWHREYKAEYMSRSATTTMEAWKKKGSVLAPGIMVLWGVLFFIFHRRNHSHEALLVLTFPVLLTAVQLMPFLQLALICVGVLAVWFWLLLKPPPNALTSSPER